MRQPLAILICCKIAVLDLKRETERIHAINKLSKNKRATVRCDSSSPWTPSRLPLMAWEVFQLGCGVWKGHLHPWLTGAYDCGDQNTTEQSRGWHLTTLPKSPNAICPIPSFAKMIRPSLEKQGKYSSSITCKTEYATLVWLFLGNTPPYSLELWDSCISKEFLNVNSRFKLGTLEALEVKEVMHYLLNLLLLF